MTRLLSVLGATILAFLLLVPVAAAADPWLRDEHFVLSTGGHLELGDGDRADVLVIAGGTATIGGEVGGLLVLDGDVELEGAQADSIVVIRGNLSLDGGTVVSGEIRTLDATVDRAPGATVVGGIADLGPALAGMSVAFGAVNAVLYAGVVLLTIAIGLVLAALAARQVRATRLLVRREPALVLIAAFVGVISFVLVGALITATVIGIPLGLGILLVLLPAMAVLGYVVAGMWLGELIVGQLSTTPRERPYLAAVSGLSVLGLAAVLPVVGGLASLAGFGAITLGLWRTFRGEPAASVRMTQVAAPSAG